jgi:hypothetical protein
MCLKPDTQCEVCGLLRSVKTQTDEKSVCNRTRGSGGIRSQATVKWDLCCICASQSLAAGLWCSACKKDNELMQATKIVNRAILIVLKQMKCVEASAIEEVKGIVSIQLQAVNVNEMTIRSLKSDLDLKAQLKINNKHDFDLAKSLLKNYGGRFPSEEEFQTTRREWLLLQCEVSKLAKDKDAQAGQVQGDMASKAELATQHLLETRCFSRASEFFYVNICSAHTLVSYHLTRPRQEEALAYSVRLLKSAPHSKGAMAVRDIYQVRASAP